MAEMILPGVYIEVRPEGLIAPGQITVGNVGVVGTAAKGEPNAPFLLGSYVDATRRFGEYDAWVDGTKDELTLVRALQLAFTHGATTVFAVRAAGTSAKKATLALKSATGNAAEVTAKSEGTWANDLTVSVAAADQNALIEDEAHLGSEAPVTLKRFPVVPSARTRVTLTVDATGVTRSLGVIFDDNPAAATPGQVKITRASGVMAFGDALAPADKISVSYFVDASKAAKVTLRLGQQEEVYTVVDGADLVAKINDAETGSAWIDGKAGDKPAELPSNTTGPTPLKGGDDGRANANYDKALDALLTVPAHIIVAAGQTDKTAGAKLAAHCDLASTDTLKRDRIAVVGSAGIGANKDKAFDEVLGHTLANGRVIFVAPGIQAADAASGKNAMLSGAYSAAMIAGKLAAMSPHVSLTNKPIAVSDLEQRYTPAQLTQLVQGRVLALEDRLGFRVVRGITTDDGPFSQITTRRIVDYAKYGVRSAANPYIGLLNNERVRAAMRATINSFLSEMVKDEMLVRYELEVTATRDDERKGIARVNMTLQPTFSIDFIKVTMFLE